MDIHFEIKSIVYTNFVEKIVTISFQVERNIDYKI